MLGMQTAKSQQQTEVISNVKGKNDSESESSVKRKTKTIENRPWGKDWDLLQGPVHISG